MTFFDTENFKIPSKDWQIQDANAIINGKHTTIQVKVNSEGDVREYVSGVPEQFIGQQLFTYPAALRETQKAGKSLPLDQNVFIDAIATMPGDTELQKYKNYFSKTNVQLVGCYSSGLHVFDDIGVRGFYRLGDGTRLHLNTNTRGVARRDEMMGYSVKTV